MKNEKKPITKVGITGAGGRIGRTLTEGLADSYDLTLFIRNTQPNTKRKLKVVKADISNEEETKGIFKGLDAVIHLAASPSTQTPWKDVLANNIVATYNVLEEARRAGVRRVIFASTNHVQDGYAMMGETPILLTSPPIRPFVRSIIERFRPSTVIMSQNEIHPKAKIKTIGQV